MTLRLVPALFAISSLLLHVLLLVPYTSSLLIDIHLPLYDPQLIAQNAVQQRAIDSNAALLAETTSEQVDFIHHAHIPHITLFLAELDLDLELYHEDATSQGGGRGIEELHHAIQTAIQNSDCNGPCPAKLSNLPLVHGAYALWNVPMPMPSEFSCLQELSNAIVDATQSFVIHNQTIPSWIYDLPEPQRSRKLKYFETYGSPNVHDEFDPHVTVGYDVVTPTDIRQKALERLVQDEGEEKECEARLRFVNVGIAEEIGTVLPGPLLSIELKEEFESKSGSVGVPIHSSIV